ncbi:MAG: cobalt-precorrin-5B (C(1))-methyltransferase [Magnetococcales bacterium]|nr:cobalt-precorrin-5B (C(1))-methyltransferase [Magnetococcales bacterium]
MQRGQRTGFTTGACAAAASRAATLGWLSGQVPSQVETVLPNGQAVLFAVATGCVTPLWAEAVVIKDAGDDPDCTHGAHLTARVRPLPARVGEVVLLGGDGVGVVTRPGLGLPLQQAAINPIPRRNIEENARAAAGDWLAASGLEIVISVPGGAALARRTLNPRLGIEGGISILGTTGVVHPYSTAAFKAAMRQTIQAAADQGAATLVLTTGRRSERFAMAVRPELPEYAFIQMGDFVGAALEQVSQAGIADLVVAAMVGKLAKMGQGLSNTHAHKEAVDMGWIARLARQVGGREAICQAIQGGTTVRHAAELLAAEGLEAAFTQALLARAAQAMRPRLPTTTQLSLLAFDFEGTLLASWKTDSEKKP